MWDILETRLFKFLSASDTESDIEVGKAVDCKVVVNHHVELTEEEKEQAHKDAIKRLENEHIAKMKQQQEKVTARRAKAEIKPQATLFDF